MAVTLFESINVLKQISFGVRSRPCQSQCLQFKSQYMITCLCASDTIFRPFGWSSFEAIFILTRREYRQVPSRGLYQSWWPRGGTIDANQRGDVGWTPSPMVVRAPHWHTYYVVSLAHVVTELKFYMRVSPSEFVMGNKFPKLRMSGCETFLVPSHYSKIPLNVCRGWLTDVVQHGWLPPTEDTSQWEQQRLSLLGYSCR